ncbi:MAG: exodeoxyribonuclease VII small subunit [Acidimicrobiales bacterium]
MTERELGYTEALAELEGILEELDGDEVDVDVLGSRVRRAAELLRLCRDRIASARFDVEQVVAELEAEAAEVPAPGREQAGAATDTEAGTGDADELTTPTQ